MASSTDADTPSDAVPADGLTGDVPSGADLAACGAAAFALAFGTYGAVEALLGVILPGTIARIEGSLFATSAPMGVAFLVAYPLAGAALGAAAGALLGTVGARWLRAGWNPRRLLLVAASACVVLALLGNLALFGHLARSGAVFLAVFLALLAVGGASARPAGPAARRWPLIGHPFLVVPLVTTLLWTTRSWLTHGEMLWRIVVCTGIFAAALLLAALVRGRAPKGGGRVLAISCALLAVGLFAVNHDPPPPAPPLAGPASPTADPNRPPVVLIVLDTVRADHLTVYGYQRDTDPNIARFASRSLVFEHAVMPGDMTLTSHASIFTGQWVSHHGTVETHPVLPQKATTLAEILRGAGYTTVGIAANCGWLGPSHGLDQGFQSWDTRCGVSPFHGIGKVFLRTSLQEVLRRAAFPEHAAWEWRSAASITDEAIATLDRLAPTHAPFLLFLNYMDVHRPIDPPERYRRMFPGRIPGFDMEVDWTALNREVHAGHHAVTRRERAELVSQYDGALAYLDGQVGRLLARLHDLGLLDRSLVIITADHGESFGAHGTFGHGDSVYQEEVRVPMIVKLPGQHEGRRIPGRVSGVDVLPTVAALLGLQVPPGVDGRSMLSPDRDPGRAVISASYGREGLQARAVFWRHDKLVKRVGHSPELYRLDLDPREQHDIAGDAPGLVTRLADEMRTLASPRARHRNGSRLSSAEAARLRALGYLEDQ